MYSHIEQINRLLLLLLLSLLNINILGNDKNCIFFTKKKYRNKNLYVYMITKA
jgi:hypothetical protein